MTYSSQPENPQENYLQILRSFDEKQRSDFLQLRSKFPVAGYSIPMSIYVMEINGNRFVDNVFPWGFADFSILSRMLADTLVDLIETTKEEAFSPFINSAANMDPLIAAALTIQFSRMIALNERIGIEGGMLKLSLKEGKYHISIADSRRRSALTLLRVKALHFEHTREELEIIQQGIASLRNGEPHNIYQSAKLTILSDLREIDVLRKGLPITWARLLKQLKIEDSSLISFLSWASLAPSFSDRWLKSDQLYASFQKFTQYTERSAVGKSEFDEILDLFSANPSWAKKSGFVFPFIRIGSWLKAWPFVNHALLPELVFVVAVQSRHPKLWSSTYGSELAQAADYIASTLPAFKGILVTTRRQKKGIGDIDLAVYDTASNSILICEIKNVFDRFRTEFQSKNFTKNRVNFSKAVKQINAARSALLDGSWPLEDVFAGYTAKPIKVHRLVLLWRDHANPTLDEGEFVPTCDYVTFRYLFKRCKGNPTAIAECIEQLEKIFWVSRYQADFWPVGDEQLQYFREFETDWLPPASFLDKLPLNHIVREELNTLKLFPPNWQDQLVDIGADQQPYFRSQL